MAYCFIAVYFPSWGHSIELVETISPKTLYFDAEKANATNNSAPMLHKSLQFQDFSSLIVVLLSQMYSSKYELFMYHLHCYEILHQIDISKRQITMVKNDEKLCFFTYS